MMRVLPGALLFVALKFALRESLRGRISLVFYFSGLSGIYVRPQAAFRLTQKGTAVLVHAGMHRFRQRYRTGSRASVTAFLLLEPL
jgi:hypothetical protein